MAENSNKTKLLSYVLLAAGIAGLAFALVLDFSGSSAGFRGPLLVAGAIVFLVGLYFFPTVEHHRSIINFIFLFPLLFTFAVTVLIPLALGIVYSFTDWNGIRLTGFVGFSNYATMFKDPSFVWSVLLTFLFVIFNMVLINVIGFMLALLCTSKMRGINFFRASYFLPNLIGGIVLGYIWQFVFKQAILVIGDATGFSLFSTSWLSDPIKAFWALIIVTVWQLSGYLMLIYIAGLMGVSDDLKEAAKIDGCDEKKTTRYITLPMMAGTFTICFFLAITRAFVTYDVNISLTEGGPYGSTTLAAMYVYNMAFSSKKYGLGQAEALILFLVIAIIAVTQAFIGKSKEVEA